MNDDSAAPGATTTLRLTGLEPGRRFEVWQTGPIKGRPCPWTQGASGGVRLGETTTDGSGRVSFPFLVADVPQGRPEAEKNLWLVPPGGGPAIHAMAWSSAVRTRLSGSLFGEDGEPYRRPVTIEATFESPLGVVEERKTTSSEGRYAFEDVLAPLQTTVRVYDGDWLLSIASLGPETVLREWRGRREEGPEPWDQPFGSPIVIDLANREATLKRGPTRTAIPLWDPPLPQPTAPAAWTPPSHCPPWRPPAISSFGEVDNLRAYKAGDEVTLRVRRLPPASVFEVWQAESMAGDKWPCPRHPEEFNGVRIGRGESDAHGLLVEKLRLADIRHDHPAKETLLWLVWPDGTTAEPVARWDCVFPAEITGRLHDERGELYREPVRVDLRVTLVDRVMKLSTTTSTGIYRFTDVPAPAELEIGVYRGDRRLTRRRITKNDVEYLGDLFSFPRGLLPDRVGPVQIDFGNPVSQRDHLAARFPLLTMP